MSITLWLLYVLIALVSFLIYKLKKSLNYWQSRGIPCEEPSPFYGSMAGAQTSKTFSEIWSSYYNKFKGTGPFAGFYLLQRPAVLVLDKDLVKNVLIKDFNNFADRGLFVNEEDDPLSAQLFQMHGDKWKSMRSKLSPTFTSGKMKFMFPTVVKVGLEFVKTFDELLLKTDVLEIKELLARFTTDVIGTCAFGIDCNSLKDPEAEFRLMGKKLLTDTRHGQLILRICNTFPELARRLHMKQTPDHIEEFFSRIVRETITLREQNNIRRNDFMDMLIDIKNNKSAEFTVHELTAQVVLFFAAGFETSSSTMGFLLYELAKNEDIQQRVREEIATVIKQHDQQFTYESMQDLQYMKQVIQETLRLYTILPILQRQCQADYVVPGHPKYVINKGMTVLIPTGAIHQDADYYPNPKVFNPDNYAPELAKSRDSILWIPFGDGPRNCIGLRFAQMQMRVALVLLLQKFKFSVCDKTPIPLEYDKISFLISSLGGIQLKVTKI